MKKLSVLLVSAIWLASFFTSCKKEETTNSILPSTATVEIPSALSNKTKAASSSDSLGGKEVYENMRLFIRVGESSAELIKSVLASLQKYGIDKPMTLTFTSEDDNRSKVLVVSENVQAGNATWQYELTVKDENTLGMQILWNLSPLQVVVVIKPSVFSQTSENLAQPDLVYKVTYGENVENGYDKHMLVEVSGWSWVVSERFGINSLKMYVGKTGDVVEVIGNTNHPNAWLIDETQVGFNWAFVGRSSVSSDIAVAQVGLPPSTLATTDGVFTTYSVYNVLYNQMYDYLIALYPNNSEYIATVLAAYLTNAQSPAYFNSSGFISCGTNVPTGFSESFIDLSGIVPFVPNDVSNLQVTFVE
jgi:hypothetical protein